MIEIRRTEIYYADLNPVKGSEQGGLRPVLILQNDIGNKHSPTTIVAAITSRDADACKDICGRLTPRQHRLTRTDPDDR